MNGSTSNQDELEALQKENKELRDAIKAFSYKGTLIEARSLPTEPLARLRADNRHLRVALETFQLNIDLAAIRAGIGTRETLADSIKRWRTQERL